MNFKIFLKSSFYILYLFIFSFAYSNTAIDEKVNLLLNQMTMDEKIGQMTQIDRRFLRSDNDIIKFGIGSILSGGGSVPEDNSIKGWADMYDHFQRLSQQTRLKIPLIYGLSSYLDNCIRQDNSVSIKRKTKRKPLIKPSNNYYH